MISIINICDKAFLVSFLTDVAHKHKQDANQLKYIIDKLPPPSTKYLLCFKKPRRNCNYYLLTNYGFDTMDIYKCLIFYNYPMHFSKILSYHDLRTFFTASAVTIKC